MSYRKITMPLTVYIKINFNDFLMISIFLKVKNGQW